MRIALAIGTIFLATATAQAAVADYCAAFARDDANAHAASATPDWQQRYDNADASCMQRFGSASAQRPAPRIAAKPKKPVPTAAKPKPLKPATDSKAKAAAISPLQEPKTVPQLIAGSPEWTAYCTKKYVSFNPAKGTYLSKTGVERKCLVTAE